MMQFPEKKQLGSLLPGICTDKGHWEKKSYRAQLSLSLGVADRFKFRVDKLCDYETYLYSVSEFEIKNTRKSHLVKKRPPLNGFLSVFDDK